MTLPWQWSVPAGLLPYESIDELIDTCERAGITALEGGVKAFSHVKDDAEFDAIARRLDAAGMRVTTFHLPFSATVDLASFYETQRQHAVRDTIRWIEASARLGCRIGVTHPTTCGHSVEVEAFDRFLDQLSRTVDDLLPTLREHDYRIAIENMTPGAARGRFGSLPEHFERISARIDDPHVGFCLDTGHALMNLPPEDIERFFAVMGERLIAFHLVDNAGDRDSHLAPGRGRVDWPRVFAQIEQLGFTGGACIEAPPFAAGPAYSADAWRELLEQTTELALASLGADAARA